MFEEFEVKTSDKVELVDITENIVSYVRKKEFDEGFCLLFVPHTTAGIIVNENADPTVGFDIKEALLKILPQNVTYHHLEGNSEAHILSSLVGTSLTLIVQGGTLKLGEWQGIYFCEFDGPRKRKVQIKLS